MANQRRKTMNCFLLSLAALHVVMLPQSVESLPSLFIKPIIRNNAKKRHTHRRLRRIQADASASSITRIATGTRQALQWISDGFWQRKVPRKSKDMQVVVVGLGRTGTTSFVQALKVLGYTPAHDDDLPQTADILSGMLDGSLKMDEGTQQLGDLGYNTGFITFHHYVEWLATQPQIQVVLTTRDTRKWANSFAAINKVAFLANRLPFKIVTKVRQLYPYARQVLLEVPTNFHADHYNDVPTLEAGFEAWNQFVRDTIPASQLLEFDVKEGWEPLCTFLNKRVPQQPFPHVNDYLVIHAVINTLELVTWIWPLLLLIPLYMIGIWWQRKQQVLVPRQSSKVVKDVTPVSSFENDRSEAIMSHRNDQATTKLNAQTENNRLVRPRLVILVFLMLLGTTSNLRWTEFNVA